jgi:hypothetical protein
MPHRMTAEHCRIQCPHVRTSPETMSKGMSNVQPPHLHAFERNARIFRHLRRFSFQWPFLISMASRPLSFVILISQTRAANRFFLL